MRIRKNFSRLFESVAVLPSSHPPPPALGCSSPSPPPSHASTRLQTHVCQLNCSPWDVMMPSPSNYYHLNCQQEEEGEEKGIWGKGIGAEEPTSITTSKPAMPKDESYSKEMEKEEEREKSVEKMKYKKKKKKKEMKIKNSAAATSSITTSCKKSDGKGWKCKRAAHHPHTLCHYHLTQLRSNSYNQNHSKVPADHGKTVVARGSTNHRNTIAEAVAGAAGTNLNYYYYSGFGPGLNKRKGVADGNGDVGGGAEEEEEVRKHLESDDDDNNVVVAHADDQDGVDDPESYTKGGEGEVDNVEEQRDRECTRKKKERRKRGRKPMKARSLKSLLS